MTVYELNRDELNQLKEDYVTEMAIKEDRDICMGELLDAHYEVADETIFEFYEGVEFVKEDFWCNI